MKNKKIVFLRSNPVDPDPRVEKEVNSLLKAGYEVKIVAWDRACKYKVKKSYLKLENLEVEIHRLGIPSIYGGGFKKNLKPLVIFQMRLFKWLIKNKNNYDIIHACDFDTAYTAYYCAKLLNKKIIYDIFDYYVDAFKVPRVLKKTIENMDHKIINNADGVIICTEKRREQIKSAIPKRLAIIHNSPVNNNISERTFDLNRNKMKIVYVGILAEGRLLKELSQVIIKNPEYELHVGGFGNLESYFYKLSIDYSNIFFYGKLKYSEVLRLEKSCDIMTALYDPSVPNHYYAAPNKFYEALMLGKPLIMVKNTGMDEIVSQNSFGELIEYNENSLMRGLGNLSENRWKWDEISDGMTRLYKNKYDWIKMEERLIELYQLN